MRIRLDIPFALSDLVRSIPCKVALPSPEDFTVTHVCTDSRIACKGDLFIAVKGTRFNGNDFVKATNLAGCITIGEESSGAHISVNDSNNSLLAVAKYYKSLFNLKACVAITGSVGKTSTKEFLRRILADKHRVHATAGNYNNFVGLSHTVFTMPKDTEYLVAELGMNHSGEISAMSKCISPDVCVITNIGTSHIGNLGSRAHIARAKAEIADGMEKGTILIPEGEELLKNTPSAIAVGYNSPAPFSLFKKNDERYEFHYPEGVIGNIGIGIGSDHMIKNIANVIAAALLLGLSAEDIKDGISQISEKDINRRIIELDGFTIFDDSYNASYESISADLDFISQAYKDLPLGVFLGDINELGDESERIHTKIGELISRYPISNLYLIGKYSSHVAGGAISHGINSSLIHINEDISDPEASVKQIQMHHLENEIILFKASHTLRLDVIADTIAAQERNKQ